METDIASSYVENGCDEDGPVLRDPGQRSRMSRLRNQLSLPQGTSAFQEEALGTRFCRQSRRGSPTAPAPRISEFHRISLHQQGGLGKGSPREVEGFHHPG